MITVSLNLSGGNSFAVGNSYNVSVSSVADILSATNVVATTNLAFAFISAGPVGIANSSSLGSQIVTENQNVQFSVAGTGQTPYSYQWYYGNAALAGQTNTSLSFTAAWNSGGNYTVVVSNQFSAITSSPPSVLTVLPDVNPPQLVNVRALAGTLNEIVPDLQQTGGSSNRNQSLATYGIPSSSVIGLSILGASISTNGLQVHLAHPHRRFMGRPTN